MCGAICHLSTRQSAFPHLPEDEDEENEEGEEDGDVVDGAQHDHQLAAQGGHEADQLEDAQQAEGAQDGEAAAVLLQQLQQAEHDDAAVEDVEAALHVLEEAIGEQLQHHLAAEDG